MTSAITCSEFSYTVNDAVSWLLECQLPLWSEKYENSGELVGADIKKLINFIKKCHMQTKCIFLFACDINIIIYSHANNIVNAYNVLYSISLKISDVLNITSSFCLGWMLKLFFKLDGRYSNATTYIVKNYHSGRFLDCN